METRGHLIIDGYNILHAWPEFRRLLRRRIDAATGRLVEAVRILHDFEGSALTVVFDGDGPQLVIEHPDETDSLTVVYSARGVTADAVIEQLLARTPSTEGWVVASADAAIARTALSYGARPVSPSELADWLASVECRQSNWIARRRPPKGFPGGTGG